MKILNLTQHPATPAQVSAGVIDLSPSSQEWLRQWLNFDTPPSKREVVEVAGVIAGIAAGDSKGAPDVPLGFTSAMIGGAPFLMGPLAHALERLGIEAVYAFSVRRSTETVCPDTGKVTKTAVFEHAGFV